MLTSKIWEKHLKQKQQDKFLIVSLIINIGFWKVRIIDDRGKRTFFTSADAIKLIDSMLQTLFPILNLGPEFVINDYPLHKYKIGEDKYDPPDDVEDFLSIFKQKDKEDEEDRDFDFKTAAEQFIENNDDNDPKLFIKNLMTYHETLESVSENWSFSLLCSFPSKRVKNYFGEKITL